MCPSSTGKQLGAQVAAMEGNLLDLKRRRNVMTWVNRLQGDILTDIFCLLQRARLSLAALALEILRPRVGGFH
jgi:hypothetical protein